MIQQKNYTIKLTSLDPFRIGGKNDPLSEADNPVAVVGSRVCIPGATLKGAYRAQLERWLNMQFNNAGKWQHDSLKPCIPSNKLSVDENELVTRGKYKKQGCVYQSASRGGGRNSNPTSPQEQTVCPICYLLGAMGLVGFINVPFLFSDISYEALYSARMERVSGTVMKGTNRSYQLIPPGTTFNGELEVLIKDDFLGWELGKPRPLKENPYADKWLCSKPNGADSWSTDIIIKSMVVEQLSAIKKLGGYKSKGFGRVKIEVSEKY